jgi:hypothetical protein
VALGRTEASVERILATTNPPDAVLIGRPLLLEESRRVGQCAHGGMTWFNVCLLMFLPHSQFDALLRPAIDNPEVTSIQFILDRSERQRWERAILPKVANCAGRDKVREPYWTDLHESISFVLSATSPRESSRDTSASGVSRSWLGGRGGTSRATSSTSRATRSGSAGRWT